MLRSLLIAALLCLPAAGGGCIRPFDRDRQPYVSPERLERGLVIVLPGIEGRSRLNEDICAGLDEGGVDAAIELEDWTIRFPGVSLWTESRNRKKADQIAQRIVQYQNVHPRRPVVLVGQSGGGAIAAWVAEALRGERQVDGIVMLAATLSPEYRLDKALSKSRRGIVNFYSHRDWILATTKVFRTMDGKFVEGAGRLGFDVPAGGPKPYQKLFQIAWSEEMESSGYSGGHIDSGSIGFCAHYIAPLVNAPEWDTKLIRAILDTKNMDRVPGRL